MRSTKLVRCRECGTPTRLNSKLCDDCFEQASEIYLPTEDEILKAAEALRPPGRQPQGFGDSPEEVEIIIIKTVHKRKGIKNE